MAVSDHVFLESEAFRTQADYATAKAIAEDLARHYPGHAWAVNVEAANGIATIQNFHLSTRYGFLLHLRGRRGDHALPVLLHNAKMAAGEFLERYKLPRGAYRGGDYPQVAADLGPVLP